MDKLRQFLSAGSNGIPNQRLVNNNDDEDDQDEEIDINCDQGASSTTRSSPRMSATPLAFFQQISQTDRILLYKRILAGVLLIIAVCLLITVAHLISSDQDALRDDDSNSTRIPKTQVHIIFESERARFVKNMTLGAWEAYRKYAWGAEALAPIAKEPFTENLNSKSASPGTTIVSAASTLYVIGLDAEYKAARDWIAQELDLSKVDAQLNVCEVVTEIIGGLMSCYSLTGDRMFLRKAQEIAIQFEDAYHPSTDLSFKSFNPKRKSPSGKWSWLSWVGGQGLEYKYLADSTMELKIKSRQYRMDRFFKTIQPRLSDGLYQEEINIERGRFEKHHGTLKSSLGFAGRLFYQNLVKQYIMTNRTDDVLWKIYLDAVAAMDKNGMFTISEHGLMYARYGDLSSWTIHPEMMEYYSCYLGAMFALGVEQLRSANGWRKLSANTSEWTPQQVEDHAKIIRHSTLASELTETCHQASLKSRTGLAPYKFHFNYRENATNSLTEERYQVEYNLNPELAESYFILFRTTRNPKYQDYAWQMAQAIDTHCRAPSGGYTGLENVNQLPPVPNKDYQPPTLIGATLKYLYLTLVDDDQLLPLDKWVFSSAGQPLPILGNNTAYRTFPIVRL